MEDEKPVEEEKSRADLTMNQRNMFREYLIGLRSHYGPYHERKEQVAWAAITIYMTAIFAVMISMVNNFDKMKIPLYSKIAFIILILVTSFLLITFLRNEFKNRVFAAEMVRVVGELLAKLSYPSFKISVEENQC